MSVIIGYSISNCDNGTHAFHGRFAERRCATCGYIVDKLACPLDGVVLKKRRFDISCTYDSLEVVSQRFGDWYSENSFHGLRFDQLPDDPRFFRVRAVTAVPIDAKRRKVRFLKLCEKCGKYDSVVGGTPIFLKRGTKLRKRSFYRTDLEFGGRDQKHPIILCGTSVGEALLESNLKGLYKNVRPIEQP